MILLNKLVWHLVFEMECDDLFSNLDWDPSYLALIFDGDFFDMSELWNNSKMSDEQLVKLVEMEENLPKYSPITEDISLDDDVLYDKVLKIEEGCVCFYLVTSVT